MQIWHTLVKASGSTACCCTREWHSPCPAHNEMVSPTAVTPSQPPAAVREAVETLVRLGHHTAARLEASGLECSPSAMLLSNQKDSDNQLMFVFPAPGLGAARCPATTQCCATAKKEHAVVSQVIINLRVFWAGLRLAAVGTSQQWGHCAIAGPQHASAASAGLPPPANIPVHSGSNVSGKL